MKSKAILLAILLGLFALVYSILWMCTDTEHKYRVDYSHGKYEWSDYTDSITYGPNQSIVYLDKHGTQVTRYGTYSIRRNENYNK